MPPDAPLSCDEWIRAAHAAQCGRKLDECVKTDVCIVGGSLGGVSAALAALRLGSSVVLCHDGEWVGGQLTSQAVTPDEHPWIEDVGASASYRRLRNSIRRYYRDNYPVTAARGYAGDRFNPSGSPVSRVGHEPRVALAVLEAMLAPFRASRQLQVVHGCRLARAEVYGDQVKAVTFSRPDGRGFEVEAPIVIDATELGDLLAVAGVEHVVGAEGQDATQEPHARPGGADARDQQAVTAGFAFDFAPGHDDEIVKPDSYTFWESYAKTPWEGPLLSWQSFNLQTRSRRTKPLIDGPRESERGVDLWHYRRMLYAGHFAPGSFSSDIVLANWHQNDYWVEPAVGTDPAQADRVATAARELSLCLAWWIQHEAPRHDGGYGYPELRMRGDVMGTDDGVAKCMYVRESRRIRALTTILEQDIGVEARGRDRGALPRADSVGVGYYNIDLHPSASVCDFLHVSCHPFQIPLGALLPVRVRNLVPACKNIGTTHLTNGAFRMHPVEWAVGEAAGALAAFCVKRNVSPHEVHARLATLQDFQRALAETLEVPLAWPRYVAQDRSLIASAYWPAEGIAPDASANATPAVWR